jgi:hypothetical protein
MHAQQVRSLREIPKVKQKQSSDGATTEPLAVLLPTRYDFFFSPWSVWRALQLTDNSGFIDVLPGNGFGGFENLYAFLSLALRLLLAVACDLSRKRHLADTSSSRRRLYDGALHTRLFSYSQLARHVAARKVPRLVAPLNRHRRRPSK